MLVMVLPKGAPRNREVRSLVDALIERKLALQRSIAHGGLTPKLARKKLEASIADVRARMPPKGAAALDEAREFIRTKRSTQRGRKILLGISSGVKSPKRKPANLPKKR